MLSKIPEVLKLYFFRFLLYCFNDPAALGKYKQKCYFQVGWKLPGKYSFGAGVGFPGSSVGKESTCNTADPGSIPGLGRSTGEGIGY